MPNRKRIALPICLSFSMASMAHALADSPLLAQHPAWDISGLYCFRSYEAGRGDFATIILNVHPGQTTAAAPGYFPFDTNALYEIYIDRDGDAVEDTTLRFQFERTIRNDALVAVGNEIVETPFAAEPTISAGNDSFAYVRESYTIIAVDGDRDDGFLDFVDNVSTQTPTLSFAAPIPDLGENRIPDYEAYANSRIFNMSLPGSTENGRVFVGQRRESLAANWGELFDRTSSTGITGADDVNANTLADLNVNTIALEVPIDWLLGDSLDFVVGVWAAVRVPDGLGGYEQVSRIGSPLFNELFIGISQKDFYNTTEPMGDATLSFGNDRADLLQSIRYPAWPALLAQTFAADGLIAPSTPRFDLEDILLLGDLIEPNPGEATADILRLNVLYSERDVASQDPLGFIAGDIAGFPNGRRPGDDIVDILLNLANGSELDNTAAPSNNLLLTDGVAVDATHFASTFPYLNAPKRPSPHDGSFNIILESTANLAEPFSIDPPEAVAKDGSGTITQSQGGADNLFYKAHIDRPGVGLKIEDADGQNVTLRVVAE